MTPDNLRIAVEYWLRGLKELSAAEEARTADAADWQASDDLGCDLLALLADRLGWKLEEPADDRCEECADRPRTGQGRYPELCDVCGHEAHMQEKADMERDER